MSAIVAALIGFIIVEGILGAYVMRRMATACVLPW